MILAVAGRPAREQGGRKRNVGFLVSLFLVSLALRPQLLGVGPLIPAIQKDLSLSHTAAGLLATIPIACMAAFAAPGTHLAGRVGGPNAMALTLMLIAVFGLARAVAHNGWLVILLTVPLGAGMGLAGGMLPLLVKQRFNDRPAFGTGVYTTGLQTGALLSTALAVPLAAVLGGWRGVLALFSVVTLGLVGAWVWLTREESGRRVVTTRARLHVSRPIVWALAGLFGLQALIFYALSTWLPAAYVERGWSESRAGLLVALINVVGIPTGLIVPLVVDRAGSRRLYLGLGSGLFFAGLLGIAVVPKAALLWVLLIGLGGGTLFPVVLMLPLDLADSVGDAAAAAAVVLTIGNACAALGPLGLGAVRDALGSFDVALWLVAGAGGVLFLSSLAVSPRLPRGR